MLEKVGNCKNHASILRLWAGIVIHSKQKRDVTQTQVTNLKGFDLESSSMQEKHLWRV